MKLIYTQTEADVTAMISEMVFGNKMMKWIVGIAAIAFLFNLVSDIMTNGFSIQGFMAWLIPILVIGGIWYFLNTWTVKRAIKSDANGITMVGEKKIELLENEILLTGTNYSTSVDWRVITELKERDTRFYLKSNRSVLACIPKSVFSNDQEASYFKELIISKIPNY